MERIKYYAVVENPAKFRQKSARGSVLVLRNVGFQLTYIYRVDNVIGVAREFRRIHWTEKRLRICHRLDPRKSVGQHSGQLIDCASCTGRFGRIPDGYAFRTRPLCRLIDGRLLLDATLVEGTRTVTTLHQLSFR